MKLFKTIAGMFAVAAVFTGCVDKDVDENFFPNPDVDFTYNVDGDQYKYDYYVVSTVQFNNTSVATGNFTWDFGDGTTSNEVSPKHKYAAAGTYRVTLTHDTKGSRTYPILIYDIVPQLSVSNTSTETIEFNNTTVDFALRLPNPENLKVRYEWKFPEGTTYEDGTEVTSFTGMSENGETTYPAPVKFRNIGSQRVEIATYFDVDGENRRLEDTYCNVQVGTSEPYPTLYYAPRKGNIKALKLIDNVPAGTKVLPYDMGVNAGSNVFNLVYADVDAADEEGNVTKQGWLYILDAGKQYYYVNDADGILGDGQITAMRTDGTGVNTVVTNVGGAAFLDPFYGCAYNGRLYYSDRNTGVSFVELTTRGAVEGKKSSTERTNYAWQNNVIPYYGRPLAFGCITNGIYRDKAGYWWWGKKTNGKCIVRFKDSDIYATQKEAESVKVPTPVLFNGLEFTSFAIDEDRNYLYVWRRTPSPGLCQYALPGPTETIAAEAAPLNYVPGDCDPVNTTPEEGVHVTQMAVDSATGRVYFCFRPDSKDTSGMTAGIYYFDPADGKAHKYGETSDLGQGIVINPNPTKLF